MWYLNFQISLFKPEQMTICFEQLYAWLLAEASWEACVNGDENTGLIYF